MPDAPNHLAPLSAVERIEPESDGALTRVQPASYLERWNTIFVAIGLFWILIVATGLLTYYVFHMPPMPSMAGLSAAQVKDALDIHKQIYDQYRQSLTDMFDLLVDSHHSPHRHAPARLSFWQDPEPESLTRPPMETNV